MAELAVDVAPCRVAPFEGSPRSPAVEAELAVQVALEIGERVADAARRSPCYGIAAG